jgi:hypothetical protein
MSLGTVPFPPPPRAWREFVDVVLRELVTAPAADVTWEPVHLLGLDAPWVGVRVPALHNEGRAWVWDIVTPEDHQRDRSLHDDPLALPVAQDTVIVDLHRDDDASFGMRLQVPVRGVPARIDVPASAVPPAPWRVELASGWTSAAIGDAIVTWFADRLGVRRGAHGGARVPGRAGGGPERFQVGDDLFAVGSSFDALLRLPAADAARVTTLFAAVAEALAPVR